MSERNTRLSVFHDLAKLPDGEYELLPSRISVFDLPNVPEAKLEDLKQSIQDEILDTRQLQIEADRLLPSEYDNTLNGKVIDPSAKLVRFHNNLRQIAWLYELGPDNYNPRIILEEGQDIPTPLDVRRMSICTSMANRALMQIRSFDLAD